MLSRIVLRRRIPRILVCVRTISFKSATKYERRLTKAAPKEDGGPLMERMADRELPDPPRSKFTRTFPVFVVLMAIASVAIFNYQKYTSSVTTSTMFALRRSDRAREALGDEIYFRHSVPWIWGEMNQLQGRIDIQFAVKGKKANGMMRFTSHRPTKKGMFETTEWSLEMEDGSRVDLLEEDEEFEAIHLTPEEIEEIKEEGRVRGFRKSPK